MENNIQNNQNQFQEEEIDIMAIIKRLWEKKLFIIKVTCVFAVIGVFVAIFTPKEYTASCVVVPETKGGAFSASSLGGLATIAGINLGASGGGEMLSPVMYDKLLMNINLRKELMQTPITFEDYEEPVTILDYYTNPKYNKISVIGKVKQYTIGLPFTILKTIRERNVDKVSPIASRVDSGLNSYTKDEFECIRIFSKKFSIMADKKKGDVTITACMPEALAAAQVVYTLQNLLQKYVIELKLQKADVNYKYIKQRYIEAKEVFEQKQEEYAKFQDANKVLSTAISKVKEEQIRNEFNVAKELFSQLTTQLLQSEMKIKEDIPILTIVEPVQIPLEKSKPSRTNILILWLSVGFIISSGFVITSDHILRNKSVKNN